MLHAIMLTACLGKKDALPDLRENYSYKDTKPFGSMAAYRIVSSSFPGASTEVIQTSFSNAVNSLYNTDAFYCCISRNFLPSESDANAILNFVAKGNTAFFSTAYIDSSFLARLNCKAARAIQYSMIPSLNWRNTSVSLVNDLSFVKDSFSYFYTPFNSYFYSTDSVTTRVVGYNEDSAANCIVVFYGKGKLFLHLAPRAFGNYFLLRNNNYHYLLELLQIMNTGVKNVYWDDYYNKQNYRDGNSSFSSLSEIMKYSSLAMAFWIMLAALLIYVFFGGKRRQRIIPVKKPNENSSVAFTETIALLYLQKNDNKNIADKMITYFNEYVRNNYFLQAGQHTNSFFETLSRKSGVGLEQTVALYKSIQHANSNNVIDDYQLLSLSEQIQQFYKSRQ